MAISKTTVAPGPFRFSDATHMVTGRMDMIQNPRNGVMTAVLDAPLVIRSNGGKSVQLAEELERLDYLLQRIAPEQYDEINKQWRALKDIEDAGR